MPDLDGFEVARRMRERADDTPIVFFRDGAPIELLVDLAPDRHLPGAGGSGRALELPSRPRAAEPTQIVSSSPGVTASVPKIVPLVLPRLLG